MSARLRTASAGLRTALVLLLVSLFASPLASPLLRWTATPCTHDGHLHYHRVVGMLHAWRNGLFFSRWLPDLAFGYGYPFFLYREPLPLYLTLWPHLLGLPLPAAINLFYALCIVLAGCFTYLWVRDIFGVRAGLVAAVAYMAAPYQLVDALVRGNQVESLALALFPLILWAGRRFMRGGEARWFVITTLSLVALALSHNISLLLFTPALILYLLFAGWIARLGRTTLLWRAALVVLLGLAMTAFYTAPAVLEIDEVTLTLSTSNRNNDFRFNFASLAEILAPAAAEDPALINPPLRLRLGWAPTLLALLGVISLLWQRQREQKAHILFMAAGALIYLFFALPASRLLWEAIPLIEFVQFPWRFVGRAALPIAVLAGASFAAPGLELRFPPLARLRLPAAPDGAGQVVLGLLPVALAVAFLLLEAMPLLYPAYCVEDPYPTIHNVHEYERSSGMVGVDPVGSYFPVTVQERPRSSPLLADYEAGRTSQRFDASALPAGAAIVAARYGPLHAEIELQTPQPFQARYLTFAFPGWTATVDGEPAPITPADPSGLITFAVPEGRHTLVIAWRSTPLRTALGAISAVAALAFLLVAGRLWRAQTVAEKSAAPLPGLPFPAFKALVLLALALLAAKLLIVDRLPSPLRRTAAPPVAHEAGLAAGGLRLTGYRLERQVVPSGDAFNVDLAWQVVETPSLALQSNVWLRDAEGLIWSDPETFRPRIYEDAPPTQQWLPGQWAWDSREVQTLSGTPPGSYELVVTLFNLADLQPLTLVRERVAVGPTAVIGQVQVSPPPAPPAFRPQIALAENVAGLRLLGYNQDRDTARPGDPLLLTLFWEKPAASELEAISPTVTLTLSGAAGAVQREWQLSPVRPSYPPQQWAAGERLRGQHLLRLPAALQSGSYQLWLEDVSLGPLQIEAPPRLFEAPPMDERVDQAFGQVVRLAGYTLAPPADLDALQTLQPATLSLALVWQALEEMETSYHVFVHLVDESGQIIAQSDAEPAQWTRPTTGWALGEYVVDEHHLALPPQLPPGALALRVGLYDAHSGARLLLPDGGDHILLQP